MLQIAIPMAGSGERFLTKGFLDPKPFIPLHGTPMIKWVVESLQTKEPARFFFIAQSAHLQGTQRHQFLQSLVSLSDITSLHEKTEGAACTMMLLEDKLNLNAELVIANSDQWIAHFMDDFLNTARARAVDGLILVMNENDPKWSFVSIDSQQRVTRVVEKEPISDIATVGVYYFRQARMFIDSAKKMIQAQERVNGEFYIAPVYNQMIRSGLRVETQHAGHLNEHVFGLGTPDDFERFRTSEISKRLAKTLWK